MRRRDRFLNAQDEDAPELVSERVSDDVDASAEMPHQRRTRTDLAVHHANTLISDLEPDLAAESNDQPDVILRPG
jgi:hypothetical protein